MAQRLSDIPQKQIRPTASPVDVYVRPMREGVAEPEVTPLMQLADSLKEFEPGIQKFLFTQNKKNIETAQKSARADRLKNQTAFAEATAQGLIPAGANPYYVKEYKKVDGELAASGAYFGYVSEQWQKSGLATKDYATEQEAAQAFQQFMGESRGEFLSQHFGDDDIDHDWLEGFETRRGAIENSINSHHVSTRLSENEKKFNAATEAKIGEIISDGVDVGARLDALALQQNSDFGVSLAKFNETAIQTFAAEAELRALAGDYTGAIELMDLMDEVPAGPGSTLGKTAKAKEARAAIIAKTTALAHQKESYEWSKTQREWAIQDRPYTLQAQRWQKISRDRQIEEWERADEARDVSGVRKSAYQVTMMDIVADPTQDFSETWAKLAESEDTADMVPTLQAALAARINANERVDEDEGAIAQLKLDIMRGDAGPEEVVEMVASRQLTYTHGVDILEDWQRRDSSASRLADQSAEVRRIVDAGRSGLKSSITGGDQFSSAATQQLSFQAQLEFDDLMADFLDRNQNPSLREVRQERAEIIKLLLSDPQYGAEALDENSYDRPPIRTPEEAREFRSENTFDQFD